MAQLVITINNDLFVDSRVIAEGALLEHESVMRMIDKYSDKLKTLGKLDRANLRN